VTRAIAEITGIRKGGDRQAIEANRQLGDPRAGPPTRAAPDAVGCLETKRPVGLVADPPGRAVPRNAP
jgi:hypothetical protein